MAKVSAYDQFGSLLKRGIGERTQAEFAKECGISPEHVSRMLNSARASFPSRSTLEKIAPHVVGGVTLEQLYAACGYRTDDIGKSEPEKRVSLGDDERIWLTIRDLKTGFHAMTSAPKLWDSIRQFLDAFDALYGVEELKYVFGNEKPYSGTQKANSEFCGALQVSLTAEKFVTTVYASLFYSKTTGGRYLISDVSFDAASLADAGVFPDKVDNAVMKAGGGASISSVPVVCETTHLDKKAVVGLGDEGRAMNVLPIALHGFGFVVDGIYDDVLLSFLKEHRDSFCSDPERNELFISAMADGASLDEVFSGFDGGFSFARSVGKYAVIPAIIRAETNVAFVLWNEPGDLEMFPINRPCVVVPDTDPFFGNRELLRGVALRYAKELRVPRYGDCTYFACIPAEAGEIHEIEYDVSVGVGGAA